MCFILRDIFFLMSLISFMAFDSSFSNFQHLLWTAYINLAITKPLVDGICEHSCSVLNEML